MLSFIVVFLTTQFGLFSCDKTCISPFQVCDTGDCALSPNSCGTCSSGQYICPIGQTTCVDSAADYGMKQSVFLVDNSVLPVDLSLLTTWHTYKKIYNSKLSWFKRNSFGLDIIC